MRVVQIEKEAVTIELDRDEIMLVNNALNEVCNGVHISESEFQTRLRADRAEARRLLDSIHSSLKDMDVLGG